MYPYSPRIDFAFKKLFGSEENTDILLAFINSILDEQYQITSLEVLNPYRIGSVPVDKSVILDLCARDEKGQQYHIEMQVNGEVEYDHRALYYWSKLYSEQLKRGQPYRNLKKTISIHILNFDFFHKEPGYHHIFRLMHANSKRAYFEHLELHFIELERFEKTNHKIISALDRWIAFLSRAEEYDRKKLPRNLTKDPYIARAFEALADLSMDAEEKEIYDAREKWRKDEAEILEKTLEKGIEQGIEQGMQVTLKKLHHKGHDAQAIADMLDMKLDAVEALLTVPKLTT